MNWKRWIIDGVIVVVVIAMAVGAYNIWRIYNRGMGATLGL